MSAVRQDPTSQLLFFVYTIFICEHFKPNFAEENFCQRLTADGLVKKFHALTEFSGS